jgi:TPR repeat protein
LLRRLLLPLVLGALPLVTGCGSRPHPATATDQNTLAVYEHDCDAGVGSACYELGDTYARGQDAPRDDERALLLLSRACELDYAGACDAARQLSVARSTPRSPDDAKL